LAQSWEKRSCPARRRRPGGFVGGQHFSHSLPAPRAAAAAIERDLSDGKRLVGKLVESGSLVSFTFIRVPMLGAGAVLVRTHRKTDGRDIFATDVIVRVGQLRGRASLLRGDRRRMDHTVLDLAAKLRHRMRTTLQKG
jgi:hypothetical protein